ncbi:MAG: hypothetical protein ACP5UD_09495, partial [Conexivisphaera sp.]
GRADEWVGWGEDPGRYPPRIHHPGSRVMDEAAGDRLRRWIILYPILSMSYFREYWWQERF